MTFYYNDKYQIYNEEKFDIKKIIKKLSNNGAFFNICGLVSGILSVLVVL